MFDTIMDLPVHILVSHFVVVLIPLTAIATIAIAVRKVWREKYARHLAAVNVAMLALTFVTLRAGEDLKDRYRGLGSTTTPKFDHEALGRTLVWIMVALAVVSLAIWAVEPMKAIAPAAVLGLAGVVASAGDLVDRLRGAGRAHRCGVALEGVRAELRQAIE